MNNHEATALLTHMEQSWPTPRWTQGALDDWAEDLRPLDAGTAGTAYARLRQRVTSRPTFAEFKAEYTALKRFDGSTKNVCELCDSTGWVMVTEFSREFSRHSSECRDDNCSCSALVPCSCAAGDATRGVHGRYVTGVKR